MFEFIVQEVRAYEGDEKILPIALGLGALEDPGLGPLFQARQPLDRAGFSINLNGYAHLFYDFSLFNRRPGPGVDLVDLLEGQGRLDHPGVERPRRGPQAQGE